MPINVLERIKPLLVFDSKDDFYHLQIIKRKKDNPELGSNSRIIKTYYITSIEYLDSHWDEIVNMCEYNNARAGLNLNRRSFEKIAFQTLRKVSEQIFNKDYFSVRKSYETVCGKYGNENDKKWIIDIDYKDLVLLNRIKIFICKLDPPYEKIEDRIKTILPTKAGYHIITSPFRLDKFKEQYPEIDVHKDNPINLYIP